MVVFVKVDYFEKLERSFFVVSFKVVVFGVGVKVVDLVMLFVKDGIENLVV